MNNFIFHKLDFKHTIAQNYHFGSLIATVQLAECMRANPRVVTKQDVIKHYFAKF